MHFPRLLTRLAAALLVATLAASAQAADDFLAPDKAFRIGSDADGPDQVRVSWTIEPGYYMYGGKFRFVSETDGITLKAPQIPPGETREDEFLGKVVIHREQVDILIPIERAAGSDDTLTILATSQGCADAGLCYPPQKQKLLIPLPEAAPAADTVAEAAPEPSPAQELDPQPATGALAALGQSFGLEDDILTAEQAFQFDAEVAGPDRLELSWVVAPETYLYADKLSVAVEGAGVSLGDFQLPEPKIKKDAVRPDGTIGDVAVYKAGIELALPLARSSAEPTRIRLIAKYQGCAERGICYPPQTSELDLDLPAAGADALVAATASTSEGADQRAGSVTAVASTSTPAAPADDEARSEQDQIADMLAGSGFLGAVALFFGFGLLLAFTPCVFPMIPILSGIIAGQGADLDTKKAFVLSLVYVLAMALTYAVVGVIAGVFGANLTAAFQNPWILTAFSLVFVLLSLSMFGFYDLQLPASLQSRLSEISNRQQGGTLAGVAIMGLLSALIVGPCVAPPLAGALIFIGQSGDALLGFFALFAMGLGMGAPLIAIGTSAGKLLPRAGAWMDGVKAVFGVAMLGVAILLMERVLPASLTLGLWGLLLVCSAIYLGALTPVTSEASGWSKLFKGLGVALLIFGTLQLIGAASGGYSALQPLKGLAGAHGGGAAVAHPTFKRIKSLEDLERELGAAEGKPVMLDLYADWCTYCVQMERETFPDPTVAAQMQRFVLLQADVTDNDDTDRALMSALGVPAPPAMLFYDVSGEERKGLRLMGFKGPEDFAEHLKRAAQ